VQRDGPELGRPDGGRGGSTRRAVETAGEEQDTVADLLGGEAAAGMAAEEFVLRIGVDESFVRVGPETVGAAEDEAAHELFRRAAFLAESRGKPVE
jgi:hypothetical protein